MLFQIGYYGPGTGYYGGGGFFANVIYFMQQYGILDVLLPFALMFGIIYAVLEKWGPFKENKKINILIGVSISILAIVPHVIGGGPDIVSIINRALPEVGLLLVAIVLLMIVTGIAGKPEYKGKVGSIAPWMALVLLLLIFYRSMFPFSAGTSWLYWLDTPLTDFIIALLVMIVIVWLIAGGTSGSRPLHGGTA